jgi:hypothetical protein
MVRVRLAPSTHQVDIKDDMTHKEVVMFLQEHWNRESSTLSSVQYEEIPESLKRHFKELPLNSPFRTEGT